MDAVLDAHPEAGSVSKEVHYLLFEVCDANYDSGDPICFEPFDYPLEKWFTAYFDEAFGKVGGNGS